MKLEISINFLIKVNTNLQGILVYIVHVVWKFIEDNFILL